MRSAIVFVAVALCLATVVSAGPALRGSDDVECSYLSRKTLRGVVDGVIEAFGKMEEAAKTHDLEEKQNLIGEAIMEKLNTANLENLNHDIMKTVQDVYEEIDKKNHPILKSIRDADHFKHVSEDLRKFMDRVKDGNVEPEALFDYVKELGKDIEKDITEETVEDMEKVVEKIAHIVEDAGDKKSGKK